MPSDCSLVTATYSASGVKIGTYGVIGPLRMDYQKVVSVLEGVGKILEDMLTNKD
jgi:heat-inducible transcriptional repressor